VSNRTLAELRSLQDWYVCFGLAKADGVAEVASVGGFVRQYNVVVDSAKLRSFGVQLGRVIAAIRASNHEVGGRVVEMAETESMVLAPKLAAIGRTGSDHLRASGMALAARRPPPSEAELEKAFVTALDEKKALRREGFTRELTDEAVGRFFALAFALEEMRRTFRDLGHDVAVTALAPEQD
jgi:multidrug efflux pump subunit AcrB